MKLPEFLILCPTVETVDDLLVDDWFRAAGQTYRITELLANDFNERIIRFVQFDAPRDTPFSVLILPYTAPFKAYMQKVETPQSRVQIINIPPFRKIPYAKI